MKKVIAFILSVVSVVITAFALVGCTNNETLEDGKFYTVTEAYEKGYLTREQVMSIAYYHNGGRSHNEEIMSENYQPLPQTPKKPSEETDKFIKNSFYNSEYWNQYSDSCTKEDIFYTYYGTYDKAIVLKIGAGIEAVGDVVWEENVDGIIINYRNEKRLSVFIND